MALRPVSRSTVVDGVFLPLLRAHAADLTGTGTGTGTGTHQTPAGS